MHTKKALTPLVNAGKAAILERKLVWILGSTRSGSTWLRDLLEEPPRIVALQEPWIGMHIGLFASDLLDNGERESPTSLRVRDVRHDDAYFFSDSHAKDWGPPLRRLILRRLAPHIPRRAERLVVQEPNGSEGADLLMGVLPRSHLLFLLRDGRDVVDSWLDAYSPGSWLDQNLGNAQRPGSTARKWLVEREAQRWVARTEIVWRAFERHPVARRLLIRYEDLLSDTSTTLRSVYSWLRLRPPEDLITRLEVRSFDALPTSVKGSGKFPRAATPGLWRENLTQEEQDLCEEVMGPMLTQMGYETGPEPIARRSQPRPG